MFKKIIYFKKGNLLTELCVRPVSINVEDFFSKLDVINYKYIIHRSD